MTLEIRWPDKGRVPFARFLGFVQKMANRIVQGHFRYGPPDAAAKYWSRLKQEAQAYGRSGNAEHLINIANYAALECEAPEHPRFHFDPIALSVARNTGKGARE